MPKFLNRKGLSHAWIKAAERYTDSYDKVGWRSVTEIIDAPRAVLLRQRHDHEIEIDICDEIFMILGQATHSILEMSGEPNVITEQRIVVDVLGKEISMKADRIEPIPNTMPQEHHLKDYKITKVWAYKFGPKPNQIAQANCYILGYRQTMKLDITKASLEMLLKDWSDIEALKHDYPDSEVMPVELPIWPIEDTQKYLEKRVKLFEKCEEMADDDLPNCTDLERWHKPDQWAVMKKGGKKAHRVFNNCTEAEMKIQSMSKPGDYEIQFRCGEDTRCERFCSASKWCNQFKSGATKQEPAF